MITNLVASVVVALCTNVTERVSTHTVSGPYPPGYENLTVYICHEEPDKDPKEKWVKTTVKRVTTIRFAFQGHPTEAKYEEVISEKEVHFVKNDEWKAQPPKT